MDKINIGRMSITSIAMLYAILKGKGERVSAVEITKELGLESGRLGGGWTTLTQKTRERPAFLIKAGAFTRRNKGGKATGKGWYWKKNEILDWKEIREEVERIVSAWDGIEGIKKELNLIN